MARSIGNAGMELEGAEELAEKFGGVTRKRMKAILRNAVTFAGTPIRKDAVRLAPRDTGTLKRALIKKVKTYEGSGNSVAIIGADKFLIEMATKKGSRSPTKHRPYNYLHLVELGHRIVRGGTLARGKRKGTGGTVVGRVAPIPFLSNAFKHSYQNALGRMKDKIEEMLNKEFSKP